MLSLVFASTVSAGLIGQSWAPAYSSSSMGSTGALQQPSFVSQQPFVQQAFVNQQPSYSMTSAASTGAYAAPTRVAMVAPMVAPRVAFMDNVAEMGSHSNPYNKLNLGMGKLIGRSAGKNRGAKQLMMGEKHVVHNDLKVLENHEADKTIFTKKVIHHSPVLHKTIRTHEIAEDAVHEKLVHHMNTVKDQFKKVPGQNYIGGEQHVDHTEAIAPAPQIALPRQQESYAPLASAASTGAYTSPMLRKW